MIEQVFQAHNIFACLESQTTSRVAQAMDAQMPLIFQTSGTRVRRPGVDGGMRTLRPEDVMVVNDIRVTTPLRTVIAALIAFLLGPDAGFFCGSIVFCDGGTDALLRTNDWPAPY